MYQNLNWDIEDLKKMREMFSKITLALSFVLAVCVQSNANPGRLNIGNDTTICLGNCITLSSNIAGNYQWSTGDTTATIKLCPTTSTQVSLKVTSGSNVYYAEMNISVDQHGVWPGDADNNGIVNANDVLNIGLAYGSSGYKRVNASNNWNAQHASNWHKSFKSGTNYKYADCNGDGKIDSNDIAAIHANWSNSHSKTTDTISVSGFPQLYLVSNTDTFYPGESVQFQIYLGTQSNPVSNVYGVDFAYQFSPGSIQTGSMLLTVNPGNCWFYGSDGPGAVISFLQADYNSDIANVAITRTLLPGVSSGYGQIGVLGIVINDNVGGKRSGSLPITYGFTQTNAIDGDGTSIALSPINKTLYMQNNTLGIKAAVHMAVPVDVYPNPVTGNLLNIDLHSLKSDQISIVDMLGNTVFRSVQQNSGLTQLQLPGLNSGIYILKVSTQQGLVTRKININR